MSIYKSYIKQTGLYNLLLNLYLTAKSIINFFRIKMGIDKSEMVTFFSKLPSLYNTDEQIDGYIEKYDIYKESKEKLKQIIKNDVLTFVDKNSIVVEYGCGTGRYLKELENSCNLICVDTSKDVIKKITSKKVPSAKLYNFCFTDKESFNSFKLEYKNKVKVFFIIEVIQILRRSKIDQLFKGIREILEDDGVLILLFPTPKNRREVYVRIGYYRYSLKEMQKLLNKHNFKIEKHYPFYYEDGAESYYVLAKKQ